jgi:uncharacterized membrane protein
MQPQSVDSARAVNWYGFGWRIFMANPGVWVAMMILIAVIMLVAQILPLVGPLALTLISPALAGGLMYSAKEAAEGRSIETMHLFRGLTDERKRAPLLVLGAVLLGLSILAGIAAVIVIGSSVGIGAFSGATGETHDAVGAVGAGMLLTFLIALIFSLAMFALQAFSIPLVMFNDVAPIEAIKSSVNASLRNVVPLIVFLVIYFALAIIAAIPFFVGFLALGPVSVAALYASFRDIFATSAGVPEVPMP